ncbi:ABC transporter permease [Aggregatilineales bacterium SYSU G02658]
MSSVNTVQTSLNPSRKWSWRALTQGDTVRLLLPLIVLMAFIFLPWRDVNQTGFSTLLTDASDLSIVLVPAAALGILIFQLLGYVHPKQARLTAFFSCLAACIGLVHFHYVSTLTLTDNARRFNTTIEAGIGYWLVFFGLVAAALSVFGARSPVEASFERWWQRMGLSLTALLLFLFAWEMIIVTLKVPRYIIPRPTAIVQNYFDPRIADAIANHTVVTAFEAGLGFVIAVGLGVPLAMLVAFSPFLSKTLYPAAVALEMVPKIAFAPLFVTWFGFGLAPKMIVVFMVCFFPIMLNGVMAFRSLSTDLLYFSQSTGANPLRMFWKIRLPAALPQIFVGLKGAATNATVGAVIAEWIGADRGLGVYLQSVQSQLRTDVGFAVIFVLAGLGLTLFYIVVLLEKLFIPWHLSQRVGGRIDR